MDPILKILKASHLVVVKKEWAFNQKADYNLPKQGWKLHVSATIRSAPIVLKRCLPLLLKKSVHFKIASHISMLDKMNQGKLGLSQMGKFVTVYPKSDKHAVGLAKILDKATKGLEGPLILSDCPFRKNSLIHYRYGSFLESKNSSTRDFYIIDPVGKKVEDERNIHYHSPDWAINPFVSSNKVASRKKKTGLFGGKFLILACLYQGPGGGVYRALDLSSKKPRQVIVKEGRKHAAEDLLGRDARERLKHEVLILKKLSGLKPVPKFYELFSLNENLYLSMEYISGKSLEHLMREQCKENEFISEKKVRNFGIKLCEVIKLIHSKGIVIRDLKPFHIMINPKGIRILDFETAHDITEKEPIPYPGISRGFSSPQLARGDFPSVTDDVFSIGSVLYYMLTNVNPATTTIKKGPRGILKYNPRVNRKMKEVILAALHSELGKRIRSVSELKEALTNV